jgi:hypothetical protein
LLCYDAVRKAHWMFNDLFTDPAKALNAPQVKRDHFDRVEIELPDRLVVLEGLDQAYLPVLKFFWWIVPRRHPLPP